MYFIPASCASWTHSSALNFTGSNRVASFSYSFTGTWQRFITPSTRPTPRRRCPLPRPHAGPGAPPSFQLARGDRVGPPVNEHPVLGLAEPLEPLLFRG